MDKRVQTKINEYLKNFKEEIKKKAIELGLTELSNFNNLLQYIYDKEHLEITMEDIVKKNRVNVKIENNQKCIAYRSNGEKCTRRKKKDCDFCGTHLKAHPYGICENIEENKKCDKIEVFAQEIQGIIHFLDLKNNVYRVEDILQNNPNPQIIYKYIKTDNNYIINKI